MLEIVILTVAAAINILLGATVFISNPRRDSNRLFLALTIVFSFWIYANYWSLHPGGFEIIYPARLIIFFACFISLFVWLVIKTFPSKSLHDVKHYLIRVLYALAVAVATLSPLVFKEASLEDGVTTTQVGPLIPFFAFLAISYVGGAVISITRQYINSDGALKDQSRILLIGIGLTFSSIIFTNFVLVLIFGSGLFIAYTPAFSLFFSISFAYGLFRHNMYDFRLIAAKALSYVVTLGLIVVVPSYAVVSLVDRWMQSSGGPVSTIPTTAAVATLIVLYEPMKMGFNNLTAKFFFRDQYDLDRVIDDLSSVTVSEYEIDGLVRKSLSVISEAIKPSFYVVLLLDSEGEFYSDYSEARPKQISSLSAIEALRSQTKQLYPENDTSVDDITAETNTLERTLLGFMSISKIEISVQLRTKDEVVGYMLFGNKKSGNKYSKQDRDLLSVAANELSVAIQNARRFDEITRFNETLRLEIERATKQLRDSNEKLQALDQAKDEFISMASHQLRTPLTSVKGYLSMVLEGDVGKVDRKQRAMLAAAFTSSQRMVYLIADLLNVSRLQTGKFIIEPQLTDLPTVVEGEIDQLKETAKAKKLKVSFESPKHFPQVYLDETKVRQVIMNFIDNAIYYTPNGGNIKIELKSDDKKIEYTVTDDGIGVPRNEQRNMFTKFYRATNAKKARPDGTGLGLFMAKKVIVDQGGALIFHSTEGSGSTFGFTFPLSRVTPPKSLLKATKKSNSRANK